MEALRATMRMAVTALAAERGVGRTMMARTKKRWRYVTRGVEGHALKLDGVNVWAFEWTTIPGLKARVKDPLYRQNFLFDVFEIRAGEQVIHFAAGEFSSNVWGFYVEE